MITWKHNNKEVFVKHDIYDITYKLICIRKKRKELNEFGFKEHRAKLMYNCTIIDITGSKIHTNYEVLKFIVPNDVDIDTEKDIRDYMNIEEE